MTDDRASAILGFGAYLSACHGSFTVELPSFERRTERETHRRARDHAA